MKATILLLSFLFISTLSQRPTSYPQDNQIYAPFTDSPIHKQQQPKVQISTIHQESKVNEEHEPSELTNPQQEQFDETLAYGILVGSIVLAFTLLRTCTLQTTATIQYPVRPTYFNHLAHPLPNQPRVLSSFEIRNQIQNHKNQIKRLKKLAQEVQEHEQISQSKRQRQTLRAYQMELKQKIEPQNYNIYEQQQYGQFYGQVPYGNQQVYPREEFVPIGRPLIKDNDSSFASEYPNI